MLEVFVKEVCISEKKGTVKTPAPALVLKENWGAEGDAHAGTWHRQISLLAAEEIEAFNRQGAGVKYGDFGENIVLEGCDLKALPVGTVIELGESSVLLVTQIGKECHSDCEIRKRTGDCIMPRAGIFARVLSGGVVKAGDRGRVFTEPRAWIICLSDKAARGLREDLSTPAVRQMSEGAGFVVTGTSLFEDDSLQLENELKRIADNALADIIFTTGGTGLAPRDITPETTLRVADKHVPGIAEAMRAASMKITPRAMLSRAESVIRKHTLIINLPGSPKACRENLDAILPALPHAIETVKGAAFECASPNKQAEGDK